MWEHVPLAWALISLATSESTQELLAERRFFFYKVKHPFGSLGVLFLFLGPEISWKLKLRIIETSLWKKMIISTNSINHDSTNPTFIKWRNPQMCSINIHWSGASEHNTQSAECFVLSFMTWKWQWGLVISHTQSALELPKSAFLAEYKKNIWADQSTEKLHVGALQCRLRASVQSFGFSQEVFAIIRWYLG